MRNKIKFQKLSQFLSTKMKASEQECVKKPGTSCNIKITGTLRVQRLLKNYHKIPRMLCLKFFLTFVKKFWEIFLGHFWKFFDILKSFGVISRCFWIKQIPI